MPYIRVFGFVAAEADVCVLLREDLRRRTLMVRWNLATDEFEVGQWLKAWIVDGDLSPDGRLFAYEASKRLSNPKRNPAAPNGLGYGSYNVVSRPPYFTALAYWPGTDDEFRLRWDAPRWEPAPPPQSGSLPPEYRDRLGHTRSHAPVWTVKDSALGPLKRIAGHSNLYSLGDAVIETDWADVDHRGRVLKSDRGRVSVLDRGGERELIDLNPLEFHPLPPPDWAKEWPEEGR